MSITYTWDFPRFSIYGSEKVVYNVEWRLSATDGLGHGDQVFSSVELAAPDASTLFTPFEELTPEQVQEWVETALGDRVAEYKQLLEAKIQNQINPATDVVGQPW